MKTIPAIQTSQHMDTKVKKGTVVSVNGSWFLVTDEFVSVGVRVVHLATGELRTLKYGTPYDVANVEAIEVPSGYRAGLAASP